MKILLGSSLSISLMLISISLFAEQVGVDNDAGWGPGRILMLKIGIALLLLSILSYVFMNKLLSLGRQTSELIARFKKINYSTRMMIFSIPSVLVVLAAYVWFSLPVFQKPIFNHYSVLAQAFTSSQIHLIEKPSSALLALDNPYDYSQRKERGIEKIPQDVSLYNNHFYFYWGPVPSLILSFVGSEAISRVKDVHLVFVFSCGLFVYSFFLSYSIWLKYNTALPPWLFGLSLLAIGLSAPTARVLGASRVYEAAITGCQFFFIGGVYWSYSFLKDENLKQQKILFASLHWALALGTRIIIFPVVLFAAGMMLLYMAKKIKPFSLKSYSFMALHLIIPLITVAAGLGWYNWARFGSVFESGLKYQLAFVNYNIFHNLFSIEYIKDNLYNYFIHPFKFRRLFPYLEPIENTFSNERLVGLLYISPYLIFAGLFFERFLPPKKLPHKQIPDYLGQWLTLILVGSSLISMITILSYYFPATRFGGDFMPSLLLLATANLGGGFRLVGKNKIGKTAYVIFAGLMALFSVAASSLIAFPLNKAKDVNILFNEIHKLLGL